MAETTSINKRINGWRFVCREQGLSLYTRNSGKMYQNTKEGTGG